MLPKTRCQPRYFPQPGHEDTVAHDGRKEGRYFVVGVGHCGSGVFTDAKAADRQTDGFSGYVKRAAKRWTGTAGVEELWASFCDQYHQDGCHSYRGLPDGWAAPTPVVRGCAPVLAPAPAPAPPPAGSPPTSARTPHPSPAPQTPRPAARTGSGDSWASPLAVRSSVSPSPLRPPPQYSMAPATSNSGRPRTALNPNGGAASTSGVSSMLSAMSSMSSSQASSSSSTHTPKKPSGQSRVQSSPNGGYDTDYFYEDDMDAESDTGAAATQQHRFWAVRGLEKIYSDEDDVFDALHQNIPRLKHMVLLSSTNIKKLRRFAAS
ncbi:hypothetical protein C8F04DRAFT_1268722 [Mycena alexandri]|uniref:Uncharacterized protein n=1 Tax=Mycena alexandri TaxID=1745969 RepID=A0AAD6SF40_9AGAR|nr:hypothetical protein C8F04DRAFT_1268722 [Mycena alexandri]